MRIPTKSPFVLFKFTSEPAGVVMFTSGMTRDARRHFNELVIRLHERVTAGSPLARYLGESDPVIVLDCSCLVYRIRGHPTYQRWPNIREENLKELCRTFSGWLNPDFVRTDRIENNRRDDNER